MDPFNSGQAHFCHMHTTQDIFLPHENDCDDEMFASVAALLENNGAENATLLCKRSRMELSVSDFDFSDDECEKIKVSKRNKDIENLLRDCVHCDDAFDATCKIPDIVTISDGSDLVPFRSIGMLLPSSTKFIRTNCHSRKSFNETTVISSSPCHVVSLSTASSPNTASDQSFYGLMGLRNVSSSSFDGFESKTVAPKEKKLSELNSPCTVITSSKEQQYDEMKTTQSLTNVKAQSTFSTTAKSSDSQVPYPSITIPRVTRQLTISDSVTTIDSSRIPENNVWSIEPRQPSQEQQQAYKDYATLILQQKSGSTFDTQKVRCEMKHILESRNKAQIAFKKAEDDLRKAQNMFDLAKYNLLYNEQAFVSTSEEYTNIFLQEPTHWNEMYKKLCKHLLLHGHVDVRRTRTVASSKRSDRPKHNKAVKEHMNSMSTTSSSCAVDQEALGLGPWVGKNRVDIKRPENDPDRLEPYKVIALNRIGFKWDPREMYWMEKFEELKQYISQRMQEGKLKRMPPRRDPLGVWCDGQIMEYNKFMAGDKKCYITKDRIDMLTEIGFVWDRMGSAWMESYEELKRYFESNGHFHLTKCSSSNSSCIEERALFRWAAKQRKKYANNLGGKKPCLTEEQIKLLNDISFFDQPKGRHVKKRSPSVG